jgi:hypothetical protein
MCCHKPFSRYVRARIVDMESDVTWRHRRHSITPQLAPEPFGFSSIPEYFAPALVRFSAVAPRWMSLSLKPRLLPASSPETLAYAFQLSQARVCGV